MTGVAFCVVSCYSQSSWYPLTSFIRTRRKRERIRECLPRSPGVFAFANVHFLSPSAVLVLITLGPSSQRPLIYFPPFLSLFTFPSSISTPLQNPCLLRHTASLPDYTPSSNFHRLLRLTPPSISSSSDPFFHFQAPP